MISDNKMYIDIRKILNKIKKECSCLTPKVDTKPQRIVEENPEDTNTWVEEMLASRIPREADWEQRQRRRRNRMNYIEEQYQMNPVLHDSNSKLYKYNILSNGKIDYNKPAVERNYSDCSYMSSSDNSIDYEYDRIIALNKKKRIEKFNKSKSENEKTLQEMISNNQFDKKKGIFKTGQSNKPVEQYTKNCIVIDNTIPEDNVSNNNMNIAERFDSKTSEIEIENAYSKRKILENSKFQSTFINTSQKTPEKQEIKCISLPSNTSDTQPKIEVSSKWSNKNSNNKASEKISISNASLTENTSSNDLIQNSEDSQSEYFDVFESSDKDIFLDCKSTNRPITIKTVHKSPKTKNLKEFIEKNRIYFKNNAKIQNESINSIINNINGLKNGGRINSNHNSLVSNTKSLKNSFTSNNNSKDFIALKKTLNNYNSSYSENSVTSNKCDNETKNFKNKSSDQSTDERPIKSKNDEIEKNKNSLHKIDIDMVHKKIKDKMEQCYIDKDTIKKINDDFIDLISSYDSVEEKETEPDINELLFCAMVDYLQNCSKNDK
ncbi:hypothetical protein TCON_2292 [Astathelohania contejeani]|uniref:Uncharacterized protein n=1 Tax=Astathelohania contejeani TaxID=164912 RepID=A0ABQ7HWF2_9MICR|nr:hypothetical protein TCON_2292 [Thelohania contejeani]